MEVAEKKQVLKVGTIFQCIETVDLLKKGIAYPTKNRGIVDEVTDTHIVLRSTHEEDGSPLPEVPKSPQDPEGGGRRLAWTDFKMVPINPPIYQIKIEKPFVIELIQPE